MTDAYIHGYSTIEQQRLTRMQEILNERQLAAMRLDNVRRFLDVGAGLGQMTRAITRQLAADSTSIGVEQSDQQIVEAKRQALEAGESNLVEFRNGNANELPLSDSEWGSFDLVHARFVLEHVSDPQSIVNQMVAATRIGGQIFLLDDDHDLLRVTPDCKPVDDAWRAYWNAYYDLGRDPLVGRRQTELLTNAGAVVTQVNSLFYGAVQGDETFELVVDNLIGVIDGAIDHLVSLDASHQELWDEAQSAIADWRTHPAATVWYSLPIAIGTRVK